MSPKSANADVGYSMQLAPVRAEPAAPGRLALLLLAIGWALFLFGGFLLGSSHEGQNRIPAWCRMASSFILVCAGWGWFAAMSGRRAQRYSLLIAIGMTLGFIGDLFNAAILTLGLPDPVLGGILAFGLGHVAYILACRNASRAANLRSRLIPSISLIAWWLFGIVCWYLVVYRGSQAANLRWPALPYTLLLATTTALATSLAIQSARFSLLAIGGALFLASDLILAYGLFQHSFYLMGDAVWLLYGPAQMSIVYSILTARCAIEGTSPSPQDQVPRIG